MRQFIFFILLAAGVSAGFTLFLGQDDMWVVTAIASISCSIVLYSSNKLLFAQGIGGIRTIVGMPWPLCIAYLVILGLILVLAWLSLQMQALDTQHRVLSLAAGLFMGWLCAMCDWYTSRGMRRTT
jgi:hypothetical protein